MKQLKQYTNRSDYWNTPKEMYNEIMNNGYIDYNVENSYIVPFNNNTNKYKNNKVYINPPFSILGKKEFLDTINDLYNNDNTIMLLIPSRTDTKYFHELLKLKPYIKFIKGRLKFNDSKNSAPFPSLIMIFNKNYNINNQYIDNIK